MDWMDEQIRARKLNDEEIFDEAFADIARAVGANHIEWTFKDGDEAAQNAFEEVMAYYHVPMTDIPDTVTDMNDRLDYLMRPKGLMRRTVTLEEGWYRDATGAMLGSKADDGSIIALMPVGISGYKFYDYSADRYVRLNKKTEKLISDKAIAFYKPFPLRKLKVIDLIKYMWSSITAADVAAILISMLIVTLLGMLIPKINNVLFSTIINSDDVSALIGIGIFMICVSLSTLMFTSVKTLIMGRLSTRMSISVEAAAMMRMLSLPASFFGDYSAGELSNHLSYVSTLCSTLLDTIVSTGLSSLFSLLYVGQIFVYAPTLVIPAVIIVLVTIAFSVVSTLTQMKIRKKSMEIGAKETGLTYALINGIQKIKMSGSERRAFAKWGKLYAKEAKLSYDPPLFIKVNTALATAISLAGTIVMYYFALKSSISVADYYSFNVAYGYMSGAFSSLAGIALTVAEIKPIIDMAKPILDAEPEISENKKILPKISGGIELSHVSFRYTDSTPYILDDISLKIKPGQYVAVVGRTGCGKSTLLRLLLGFEKPDKGAVYYDGHDLSTLDLKALRRNMGIVIQNGKLFNSDIYSNITIAAPWLTLDDAWEAAEVAGLADDIREMPMGMNTMISEGQGGISGGQKQRLMIARAVAAKPKILMFDEATSALDNITQKKVTEALDNMGCTRLVIAHRLSTIRCCDRIIVISGGHIVEDGTYDELIALNGFFAELVARQRVDA